MKNNLYSLSVKEKLIVLYIFIILVSQGMISPYFYLNWIFGAVLIIYSIFNSIARGKVQRSTVYTFILSISWLLVPIIQSLGTKIINLREHYVLITTYIFYMSISVIIVSYLIEIGENKRNSIMIFLNEIWIFISLITYVFFLFFNDFYGSTMFSGVMENRNNYAIATTILISYLLFFKDIPINKRKRKFLIVSSFFLVLATSSVKGFIGWLIIYIFTVFLSSKVTVVKKRRNQIFVVFFAMFLFILLVVTDNPIIYRIERFIMVFTSPEDLRVGESAYLRSYFIIESISIIKQNFFSGIGFRNSRYYLIPPYLRARGEMVGTYSHVNYLELLLSGGIFTFIFYYSPFLISMFILRKSKQISNFSNYIFLMGLFKLFIDFGSVNYDFLFANIVFVTVIYGQFIKLDTGES